jgi:hypothetical protein
MKDWPQSFSDVAKQRFTSSLWDKDDVILAIPTGMRQALIGVRHGFSFRCALIKPPEGNSTPGTLKAVLVSLVKPVASLKNRVMQLVSGRAVAHRIASQSAWGGG